MISHKKRKLFRSIWEREPAKEDCTIRHWEAAAHRQSWGPGLDQQRLKGRSVERCFGLDESQIGMEGTS